MQTTLQTTMGFQKRYVLYRGTLLTVNNVPLINPDLTGTQILLRSASSTYMYVYIDTNYKKKYREGNSEGKNEEYKIKNPKDVKM